MIGKIHNYLSLCMVVLVCGFIYSQAFGVEVVPKFVGNAEGDSVYVSFTVIDTLGFLTAPDSVNVLKVGQNLAHLDSVLINSARLKQIKPGCYRAAFRGSDGAGALGSYTIYVMAYVNGAWRGAAGTGYEVVDEEMAVYLARLDLAVSSVSTQVSGVQSEVANLDGWNPATTGVLIATNGIQNTSFADNAISSGKIASSAITSTKIADNAISATKIANSAITNLKLADNAISATKIGTGAITSSAFAAGAITAASIESNAITSDEFSQSAADKVWASVSRTLTDYLWTEAEIDSVLSRQVEVLRRQSYWIVPGWVERICWDSAWAVDTTAVGADTLKRTILFYYDVDSNQIGTGFKFYAN